MRRISPGFVRKLGTSEDAMVLSDIRIAAPGEVRSFTWQGLSRFQNVSYTADHIRSIQSAPASQRKNIEKQATQVRHCITQAQEYFKAASVVSMATKPLLLYYGTLSLILAEILIKNNGLNSLDKARGEHAHHGLELAIRGATVNHNEPLHASADQLVAKPFVKSEGRRFGTFELWHRSARETPVCGKLEIALPSGAVITRTDLLLGPEDERLPEIPPSGVTLLECLQNIPGLYRSLYSLGTSSSLVRSSFSLMQDAQDWITYRLTIQPEGEMTLLGEAANKLLFEPSAVNVVEALDVPLGYVAKWRFRASDPVKINFLNSMQATADNWFLCPHNPWLNELGVFYIGLYILGNFSRYYPDMWMANVERASALSLASQEFIELAEARVPLLSLSEISRSWTILGDIFV